MPPLPKISVPPVRIPKAIWWFAVIIGMTLNCFCGFYPYQPMPGYLYYVTNGTAKNIYAGIFIVAVLIHVFEALFALHMLVKRTHCDNVPSMLGWVLQTFILGFPSLGLLLAKLQVRVQ